jgi:hypothetical protein
MRYSLRTLLLMVLVGPPLLAGAWLVGNDVVAAYRERQETWEDLGGSGSIMTFEEIGCVLIVESEDTNPTE